MVEKANHKLYFWNSRTTEIPLILGHVLLDITLTYSWKHVIEYDLAML
jgi:hypothetical protein